jgi:MFS transporter, AAHS family, 4-hydroxybenzoate transporter
MTTIDASEWIARQEVGRLQILVVILSGACALLEGFDAQSVGYAAPALIHQWGLSIHSFTPAFLSGLAGLLIGCLAIAPLADHFGRKKVIVGSVVVFACCSLLTATANSLESLSVLRFFTGLGVGGAMPNAIALTSEFFSERKRAAMTVIMFCGFALGAALGGFLSAYLIPHFGWQSIFIVGGALPALLTPFLIIVLPESVQHLVVHNAGSKQISEILKRINPRSDFSADLHFVMAEKRKSGFTVIQLFQEGRMLGTLLIWLIYFMSLLAIYLISSWLPTVLNDAGLSVSVSATITGMHQLSGVLAALLASLLLDRWGCISILLPAYMIAALGIAMLGSVGTSVVWLTLAACVAGAGLVCGQLIANAFAAAFYPVHIRATGVGWALGIGRIGAIVGPGIAGTMLGLHWRRSVVFLVAAVPALVAALAVLGLSWLEHRKSIRPATSHRIEGL